MVADLNIEAVAGPNLRLQTLVMIRWIAIAGQTFAVLGVAYGMGFELPLSYCLLLIALSAWLNVFLRVRFPLNQRLRPTLALWQLGYDVLQLAGLLFLTGGLQNPFAMLLIAPVMVSATVQPVSQTITLIAIAIVAASVLVFQHLPLPWHTPGGLSLPFEFIAGTWTAITLSLVFIAIYAFRVAKEGRDLANALAATELVLQREQHLSTMDGLAAAAAHELGTPLATIALVSKEMMHELDDDSPLKEDAKLLRSQAERCREILQKLTSLSDEGDHHIGTFPLGAMIEEVVSPHRDFDVGINISLDGEKPEPICARNPAILYGLGNLVENAVDFARETVRIHYAWNGDSILVTITDDGPGFQPEQINRIGEPFLTSRGATKDGAGRGLGLGLFIAKTLLERSGATLSFSNSSEKGGAHIEIQWLRERVEQTVDRGDERQSVNDMDETIPSPSLPL